MAPATSTLAAGQVWSGPFTSSSYSYPHWAGPGVDGRHLEAWVLTYPGHSAASVSDPSPRLKNEVQMLPDNCQRQVVTRGQVDMKVVLAACQPYPQLLDHQ